MNADNDDYTTSEVMSTYSPWQAVKLLSTAHCNCSCGDCKPVCNCKCPICLTGKIAYACKQYVIFKKYGVPIDLHLDDVTPGLYVYDEDKYNHKIQQLKQNENNIHKAVSKDKTSSTDYDDIMLLAGHDKTLR